MMEEGWTNVKRDREQDLLQCTNPLDMRGARRFCRFGAFHGRALCRQLMNTNLAESPATLTGGYKHCAAAG